jgi:hypothetical protein
MKTVPLKRCNEQLRDKVEDNVHKITYMRWHADLLLNWYLRSDLRRHGRPRDTRTRPRLETK